MSLLVLYNATVSKLEALLDNNGKQLFPTVGFWNNQINNESIERGINFPACYIHFPDTPWVQKTAAGGFQDPSTEEQRSGDGAVMTIHICHSLLQDAKNSFSIIQPINERVYFALNNQKSKEYGPIVRIKERQDDNHDRVLDWQMDFRFQIIQAGQSVNKTAVEADSIILNVNGTT